METYIYQRAFPISNHPLDKNILRDAYYSGHSVKCDPEDGFQVELKIRVEHYFMKPSDIEGGEPVRTKHPLPNKWVKLIADRSMILENGVDEFHYFISLMDIDLNQAELIKAKIEAADTEDENNRYNKD